MIYYPSNVHFYEIDKRGNPDRRESRPPTFLEHFDYAFNRYLWFEIAFPKTFAMAWWIDVQRSA